MKFAYLLATVLSAALVSPSARPQATIGGEWREDVERFARSVVEAGLVPGMGIGVSDGDWVVYSGGFGIADMSSGRRVGEETAFYIASSTKALTATAVLALHQRGEIELGAPVTDYLPGLQFRPPLDATTITIRSLLTMTHGIEDGGPVVVRTAYSGDFTSTLLLELLADYGPSDFGTAFRYGNLAYNILGLVLDPEDGHGWKEVVRREVLAPLGMHETWANLSDISPGVLAMPHEYLPEGFRRILLGKDDANLHAAGGHFATPRQLARFTAAQASRGRLNGRQIFSSDAIESAHQAQVEQKRQFGPFRRFGWGYGWDIGTYEGMTVVHRFGGFAGYRSHMSFSPDHGIGVVVLVNGGGPASPAADLVATYIYDRLTGKAELNATYAARLAELRLQAVESAQRLTAELAQRRERIAPLRRRLQDYAGIYDNPQLGRMEWRVVGGGLEARMGIAHSRAEIFDATDDRLRITLIGGGAVADFTFPPEGGVAQSIQYLDTVFVRVDAGSD